MAELTQTFLAERQTYSEKRIEWHKAEEQVLRIIQAGAFDYLKNEKARNLLKIVAEEKRIGKLTIADKDAIAHLEHQELYDAYDAAKFNASTSEKAFLMFSSILIGSIGEAKLEQKIGMYQP
jgi:hypothetical protein